ncbi:MAG: AAA family ATPase [Bacteroidota bacterium]
METPDRPLITRLRATNFRSIADMDLELGPLTVIVGRNGAGKSNTIDVLRFLRSSLNEGAERALSLMGGWEAVAGVSTKPCVISVDSEPPRIGWEARFEASLFPNDTFLYRFLARADGEGPWVEPEISEQDARAFALKGFSLWLDSVDASSTETYEDAVSRLKNEGMDRVAAIGIAIGITQRLMAYEFVSRDLRDPQRVLRATPLQEEGQNLVSTLRSILTGPRGISVRRALQALVHGVDTVEVVRAAGHIIAELVYKAENKERRSDLGLESDGTIRMLAILVALYQTPAPPLIVIEEPEANLHPGALGVLADVIKEASLRTQVIITTHSPDLIDHFDPEVIRVVERVDGVTVVGKVQENQREIIRQKLYRPGELMRVEGLQRETAD